MEDPNADMIEEGSIPKYDHLPRFNVLQCSDNEMSKLLEECKDLFRCSPGVTDLLYHTITFLQQASQFAYRHSKFLLITKRSGGANPADV